jgi:hypothetical protein
MTKSLHFGHRAVERRDTRGRSVKAANFSSFSRRAYEPVTSSASADLPVPCGVDKFARHSSNQTRSAASNARRVCFKAYGSVSDA